MNPKLLQETSNFPSKLKPFCWEQNAFKSEIGSPGWAVVFSVRLKMPKKMIKRSFWFFIIF
jgi:hypothetical protein